MQHNRSRPISRETTAAAGFSFGAQPRTVWLSAVLAGLAACTSSFEFEVPPGHPARADSPASREPAMLDPANYEPPAATGEAMQMNDDASHQDAASGDDERHQRTGVRTMSGGGSR